MSLVIELKVVPSSGKQRCILDKAGILKCYLKNPPERGLANDELVKMVAKSLGIPQRDVSIITGAASRTKKIKIEQDISRDQLLTALAIEQQMTIVGAKKG